MMTLNMESKTYSIDELCVITNLPKRTVRYYIQLGLVDRPVGETKAAHYLSEHLDQLLRVKKLTEARVPLDQIRQLIEAGEDEVVATSRRQPGSLEVKTHIYISPGIELLISAEEAGLKPEQMRELLKTVMRETAQIMKVEGGSGS